MTRIDVRAFCRQRWLALVAGALVFGGTVVWWYAQDHVASTAECLGQGLIYLFLLDHITRLVQRSHHGRS